MLTRTFVQIWCAYGGVLEVLSVVPDDKLEKEESIGQRHVPAEQLCTLIDAIRSRNQRSHRDGGKG
jgi:hypothetical protein